MKPPQHLFPERTRIIGAVSDRARIRIGVVSIGTRGASGPVSFEIASHLGQQAEVFGVLSVQGSYQQYWREAGIPFIDVSTYRGVLRAAVEWLAPLQARQIAQQIRQQQPDVLLYPMFYTWNPLVQRFLRDIPNVVAVHDPVPHPGLMGQIFKVLEDASISQATRGIIFSRVFVPDMVKRGLPAERVNVVPMGDYSFYRRWNHDLNTNTQKPEGKEAPVLLFFGRIAEYKGLEILLQAYQQVRQQTPAKLMVVGDGDLSPYRGLLEGLPDVTLVNRWIEDEEIHHFFSQADLVVLPYTSASQSGIVQIAATYALPVIATRVGGLPEQIIDGENGLLVAPKSVGELAQAILRLLVQPELARRLGMNLQKTFQQERSWAGIAQSVLEVCEAAAATKNPRPAQARQSK